MKRSCQNMLSKRSVGQLGHRRLIKMRPPKPIKNAILVLRGKNGISQTIYFTEENGVLLRQIVRVDEGMEKDENKVPEK